MKLYIDHYAEIWEGKTMVFATREGILREHHSLIVEDLKFITRKGVKVVLYHNIGNNRGNRKFLNENLTSKLPNNDVDIIRISGNKDIYAEILSIKQEIEKFIILERQSLIGENGEKINTISTNKLQSVIQDNDIHGLGIGNINFRKDLLEICKAINSGNIHRVHVLAAGKRHSIKHELFSLEGSGTLIGDDFGKPDIIGTQRGDEDIILGILNSNKGNPYLKKRKKEYIKDNILKFRIAQIDGIPVGCIEIITIDSKTIELGALAVIKSFLSLKIGFTLIEYIQKYAYKKNKDIISLTNNPKLQDIYKKIGFTKLDEGIYQQRLNKSPGIQGFILEIGGKT